MNYNYFGVKQQIASEAAAARIFNDSLKKVIGKDSKKQIDPRTIDGLTQQLAAAGVTVNPGKINLSNLTKEATQMRLQPIIQDPKSHEWSRKRGGPSNKDTLSLWRYKFTIENGRVPTRGDIIKANKAVAQQAEGELADMFSQAKASFGYRYY